MTIYSRVHHSSQFEGSRVPRTFTELLEKPELKFHGVQTPYVLGGPSLIVSILMSEKRILRPLCHLSATRGQQTTHDTVQDRCEGLQEGLYVCVACRFKLSSKLMIFL
jgi:hypothetical protein